MMINQRGFTIIELVTIIILLGILSVTAIAKFPSGFEQDAAEKEMVMAIRYAQHHAMTRQFTTITEAWGIVVNPATNEYSVFKRDEACGNPDYCNRQVLAKNIAISTNIAGHSIWFNGLGQPFDNTDTALAGGPKLYIGQGTDCTALTISPETGFVQRGSTCP